MVKTKEKGKKPNEKYIKDYGENKIQADKN